MKQKSIAEGVVTSLCINGNQVSQTVFGLGGPQGDCHFGFSRGLSGHDGDYIKTSNLSKGSSVFNWRSWTGLSQEEIQAVGLELNAPIPVGCLLENMIISGIPDFSQLEPTSRLVFPHRPSRGVGMTQAILAVWEENGPCRTVADRLEQHHNQPGLKMRFISAAQNKRGVMGFVLAGGLIRTGDKVLVFPPV